MGLDLSLYLNVSLRGGNTSRMCDWVKDEIGKARRARERGEHDQARRLLDRKAIKKKGGDVWDNLINCILRAVNAFNEALNQADDRWIDPSRGDSGQYSFTKSSYPQVELNLRLDLDTEIIEYSLITTLNRGSEAEVKPGRFCFEVDNTGQPYLTHQDTEVSINEAAHSLLKPIFRLSI